MNEEDDVLSKSRKGHPWHPHIHRPHIRITVCLYIRPAVCIASVSLFIRTDLVWYFTYLSNYYITVSRWRQRTPTAATHTSYYRQGAPAEGHPQSASYGQRTSARHHFGIEWTRCKQPWVPDDDVRLLIDDTITVRQIFIQTAAMK